MSQKKTSALLIVRQLNEMFAIGLLYSMLLKKNSRYNVYLIAQNYIAITTYLGYKIKHQKLC